MAAVTQIPLHQNSNHRHRQPSAAVSTYSKSQPDTPELKNSAIFLNFMAPKAFLARLRTGNDSPKAQQKSCTLNSNLLSPLIALKCVSSVDRRAIGWETQPNTFRFLVHLLWIERNPSNHSMNSRLFRVGILSNDLINGKANNLFSQSPESTLSELIDF